MTGGPVDLREVRRERLLDELAGLARRGVDVHGLLEAEYMAKKRMASPVSVRLRTETIEEAERLVEELGETMEARAAGGQWSRATVLRWAVEVGIEALAVRARDGGR